MGADEVKANKTLMNRATNSIIQAGITMNKTSKRLEGVAIELTKMIGLIADSRSKELELAKIKLKTLEVKNSQSSNININKRTPSTTEQSPHPKKSKTIDDNNNISKELDELKKEVLTSTKINFKRDYKLTQKSNFDIWYDYLISELTSNDLIDVLDENQSVENDLSESFVVKRKNYVRDIIINHIDESYHKKILNMTDPVKILQKLKSSRKDEINITGSSVRKNLWSIKMKKNEKVSDFCERFDSIIREYDACGNGDIISEQEIRAAFYQAVTPVIPQLRQADLIKRTNSKEMNLEEIKSFILQLEAEKKQETVDVKVQHVKTVQKKIDINCYRCAKPGHVIDNCPLDTDLWYCYWCQAIKKHKGNECNEERLKKRSENNKFRRNFKKNYNKPRFNFKNANFKNNKNFKDYKNNNNNNNQNNKPQNNFKKTEFNKKYNNQARRVDVLNDNQDNEQGNERINREITFIADSGATDHIINNSLILSNFEKCPNKIIKSANKNKSADIMIDGKGDLLLHSNSVKNGIFKLSNVISAKDISENLLSLRKLADEGFSIYLDDEKLRIFNKESDESILEGIYEKPNWILNFKVKKISSNNSNENLDYDEYHCKAIMIENLKSDKQSQVICHNTFLSNSEGDLKEKEIEDSSIMREVDNLETKIVNGDHIHWDSSLITRETIKIDDLDSLQNLEEILVTCPLDKNSEKLNNFNEGMLWHVRLGHASLNYLKKLQKTNKCLEKVKFEDSISDCEVCIMSKMQKLPFKESRSRATRPLQLIHTDTMGPIKPTSHPGHKRFINVYIDDYSRLARAYSTKTKDESGDTLEKFLISTRNLLGKNEKVCYIRSDQGTEFTGKKFLEVLRKENIEIELTPPYTPEHNGVSERFNATIQRKVRTYMIDSGLPSSMWELAVDAAVHAYNRTPHKSIDYQIPLLRFNPEEKCHFDKIRRFGCISYIKIPKPTLKFGERAIKAVMVGYKTTGYLLWHPSTGKFLESRHVRFNEKLTYKDVYKKNKSEVVDNTEEEELKLEWNEDLELNKDKKEEATSKQQEKKKRGRPCKNSEKKEIQIQKETSKPLTRSQTKRKLEEDDNKKDKSIEDISFANYLKINTQANDDELKFCLLASVNSDPTTFTEASTSTEKSFWMKAVNEEIDSMIENKVWKLINRKDIYQPGKSPNIIDSKWVFKKKLETDGSTRYKARLVIRGFKDKNDYDLRETYAPVSRLSLIRAVLIIINKYNLETCQLDVKTAFLNGILDEEIYMEIPDGLTVKKNIKRQMVCKLEKALYGLKISPKKWNRKFTTEVEILGLENDLHEPCLYTWRKDGKMAVLVIYVDDIIVASNDVEKLNEIINHLKKAFKMTILGEPRKFLGMEIQRNRQENQMIINQSTYIENILKRFNMKECKPQNTPMVTKQVQNRSKKRKLEETQKDLSEHQKEFKKVPFREAIGSLMYLANGTRPDIAYAVNYLARRQLEATESDWSDVQRIFRYLRGTSNLGLKFTGTTDELEAYTDASFRDLPNSTSTGGYVVKLFGDVVCWRSHKQNYASLSTCQAEYLAMSDVCQELISLDKAIRYIIGRTLFPIIIWCDNKSAGDCTKKEGSHKLKMFDESLDEIKENLIEREKNGNRKHMADTHGDFIKQCVNENKMKILWINTKENIADIMTKPLPNEPFRYLRGKLLN